jgi:hypothetical protein
MVEIKTFIYTAIALAILFIFTATIILPNFATTYNFCQIPQWKSANGGVTTNCTSPMLSGTNTSLCTPGSTYTQGGFTANVESNNGADSFCLNCNTPGTYRSLNQGVLLLTLVVGIIGFGIYFIKVKR